MIKILPPSLDKSRHLVRDEVDYARSLSPEERLTVVAFACKAALMVLNMHSHCERILRRRDPVPESTIVAFKRLKHS